MTIIWTAAVIPRTWDSAGQAAETDSLRLPALLPPALLRTRDADAGAMAEGQPDPWDLLGHFYKESVLPIKTRSF